MKRYLFSVILLLLTIASPRSGQAAAADKLCGGASKGYTLDSTSGAVTFDSDCNEIVGTAFGNGNDRVKSIDLSNTSVTKIDAQAFTACSKLVSVKVPASITSIGDGAFQGCFSLASVDLSNTSLTSIGTGAFLNMANPSTITVTKGSKAHELLGGLSSVTDDPILSTYGNNYTKLILVDAPTPTPTPDPSKPTPDPLDPTPLPSTPTPEPGTASGAADVIRVVPLPEDEFGSYEVDPVTGEKNYLMFNTYAICMDFLNNDELCSGYERCYHK